MVPRPPEWSSRAAIRVIDEREKRNRSKKRKYVHHETVESSLMPNSRGLSDDGYYAGFRKDYWSPYECTFIFHKTKYALTVGVGKLFGRYTLLVYRHPWMFIIFPAAVCLLLGVGFLFRKVVTDNERQYALPKSTSRDDAKQYTETFRDSLIRTEMIYVTAASQVNLLTADFLNALWNFHISILDLEVTASLGNAEKKTSSAVSARQLQQQSAASQAGQQQSPPRVLSDDFPSLNSTSFVPSSSALPSPDSIWTAPPHLFLPPAHLSSATITTGLSRYAHFSPCSSVLGSTSKTSDVSAPSSPSSQPAACALTAVADPPTENVTAHYVANGTLTTGRISAATPRELGAAWPQTFGTLGSGRIFSNRWWRGRGVPPVSGGSSAPGGPVMQNFFPFPPPPVGAPPPAVPPPPPAPGEDASRSPPRGEETSPPTPCEEAAAHPRNRISGLACRPPVKSGHYAFSNLCWKDAAGICTPPDGVIFMYNNRGEFGQALGYPRHTNWMLATEAPTDIWLSTKGLQLKAAGSQAQGTEGFALRYLLSDAPAQRPAAIEWESALMRHISSANGRLPGASIYVKTEQSLADDLSSSTDPTGHEDLVYVLIAAALIFIYIGFATFSTNRYRSKMLVSLIGGLAAALAHCGGAGLCYLVGVEHTTTVTAAPFLVLGIGVDDVFVIINSYALTYTRVSARERLRITMRDSGTSITVTTLTNLISFAIGSTSPYLAIKNFCVITAAGLLAGYLMCITFFLGCLTIDARYEEKKRLDEVCSCLLPVYFHRNQEGKAAEASTGPSPARSSPSNGSGTVAATSREQETSSNRKHNGKDVDENRTRRVKQFDSDLHKKHISHQSLTEADRETRFNNVRQSLLNRHATTVYECVTLQVAMAVTKGKIGKKRSSRKNTPPGIWRRKISPQTGKKHRFRCSPFQERHQQDKDRQPGAGVCHPLSTYRTAVASYNRSPVIHSLSPLQRGQEPSESRETHRTDITSQEAHADGRVGQIHSAAHQRGLRCGSFDGDLVLTHQIPLRTSSNSTLMQADKKKKHRKSDHKNIHNMLRGKFISREGKNHKLNNIRLENGPPVGWRAKKKGKGAGRDQRCGGEHSAGEEQLKESGGCYSSRKAHRRRISRDYDFPYASGISTYAPQQRRNDAAVALPAARRRPYSLEPPRNGSHHGSRRDTKQNELDLQCRELRGSHAYENRGHGSSQPHLRQKQLRLRGNKLMESSSQEKECSSYEALKSHSYEQTDLYYSSKYKSKQRESRRYSRRRHANYVNNRQHLKLTQPMKKTKKISYKRRNQQALQRHPPPARLDHNFVYGSVAQKPRVSYKRECLGESENLHVQQGATVAGRFRMYPHWQEHHQPHRAECREVMQSGNLPVTQENQGHRELQRENTVAHGGALKAYERGFEKDVSSEFEQRPHFQRPKQVGNSSVRVAACDTLHSATRGGSARAGAKGLASRGCHKGPAETGQSDEDCSEENLDNQSQARDLTDCERKNVPKEPCNQKSGHMFSCAQANPSDPWNATVGQQGTSNQNACSPDIDADEQKAANPRKTSLLRSVVRNKVDISDTPMNTRASKKHCHDQAAFNSYGNIRVTQGNSSSLPAQKAPQARRHELLRILKPEDLAEPPGNVGRRWRLLVLHHLGRLFITPVVKLVVLMVFAALFAVAVIGCTRLKRGLDPRLLSKDGSSLKHFFEAQAKYFSTYGDPVDIFFLKPDHPCSLTFKSEYAWFHKLLESRQYTKLLVDGLDTYFRSPLGGLSPSDNPAACVQMLRSWLQTPIGSNFAWQFTWKNDSELAAFQIQLVPQYYSGSQELSDFMALLREDLKKFKSAKVHAYNKHFIFYESDSNVLASTLSNMAWAALAVTMVSLVLLPSLWSAAMVIFILILIDVSIMGFMYYWNLPLNMLTMVNLIISIGFSIDYASHMCHTFSHCVGRTRDMRVFETLVLIGNPIFHGVMSTQLGVLVLAYTHSYVLKVFFKMMTLVLTLAFAHGAILLPVLLSLIGPMGSSKEPLNAALNNFRRGLTLKKILSKKSTT